MPKLPLPLRLVKRLQHRRPSRMDSIQNRQRQLDRSLRVRKFRHAFSSYPVTRGDFSVSASRTLTNAFMWLSAT